MKAYLFIVMISISFLGYSQYSTTTFNLSGNWSVPTNWSNGIPTATTNVIIGLGNTLTVDANGECRNMNLYLGSLVINTGVTLTVNGDLSVSTSRTNTNNGTIVLKGGVKPLVGPNVMTVSGSVTLASGLTFPDFSID